MLQDGFWQLAQTLVTHGRYVDNQLSCFATFHLLVTVLGASSKAVWNHGRCSDRLSISPSNNHKAAASQFAGNKCEKKTVDAMLAPQMFELLMQSRKILAFTRYLSLF